MYLVGLGENPAVFFPLPPKDAIIPLTVKKPLKKGAEQNGSLLLLLSQLLKNYLHEIYRICFQ